MPLCQNHAAALSAYNAIDPADADLKEDAYADVQSAFEALAAPLKHTQDRLCDLPVRRLWLEQGNAYVVEPCAGAANLTPRWHQAAHGATSGRHGMISLLLPRA